MSSLPSNVRVSTHPCLLAKLSQLRSASTSPKETKALVHEISLFLAVEALGAFLTTEDTGVAGMTPMGASFEVQNISPRSIALVPVLRSGLGMVEGLCFSPFPRFFLFCFGRAQISRWILILGGTAFETLLPVPVPIHHLGLFREMTTLQPVEYYNNLPTRVKPTNGEDAAPCDIAIILDPVIATGGTAEAAIQTLREWGVKKVHYPILFYCSSYTLNNYNADNDPDPHRQYPWKYRGCQARCHRRWWGRCRHHHWWYRCYTRWKEWRHDRPWVCYHLPLIIEEHTLTGLQRR